MQKGKHISPKRRKYLNEGTGKQDQKGDGDQSDYFSERKWEADVFPTYMYLLFIHDLYSSS